MPHLYGIQDIDYLLRRFLQVKPSSMNPTQNSSPAMMCHIIDAGMMKYLIVKHVLFWKIKVLNTSRYMTLWVCSAFQWVFRVDNMEGCTRLLTLRLVQSAHLFKASEFSNFDFPTILSCPNSILIESRRKEWDLNLFFLCRDNHGKQFDDWRDKSPHWVRRTHTLPLS